MYRICKRSVNMHKYEHVSCLINDLYITQNLYFNSFYITDFNFANGPRFYL